jgi:hypothetical protein
LPDGPTNAGKLPRHFTEGVEDREVVGILARIVVPAEVEHARYRLGFVRSGRDDSEGFDDLEAF